MNALTSSELAISWAARITATWRQSVEAVIETGRLIASAKAGLPHGEFLSMCETQLPFCARTAQMLMRIGADGRLSDAKYVSLLPAHWGALHDITRLDDETLDARIMDGTINPNMERKNVPRPNGARSIMSSRQEPDDSLDYFPTPPWATRALIDVVFRQVGARGDCRRQSVWEPACGEGHMAEVLGEYFKAVCATDVHAYGYGGADADFLADGKVDVFGFDWIITNSPFGDKTEAFVLRAIERAKIGVAMFVRLQWLESVGRYEAVFRDHPPTVVAFFAERVPICKGRWDPEGSTATAYIWLVWVKGRQPRAPFWIPPGQREALTRPDDAARFTAHPVIKRESLPPHDPETGEITDGAPQMGAVTEPAPEPGPAMGAGHPSVDEYDIPGFLKRTA